MAARSKNVEIRRESLQSQLSKSILTENQAHSDLLDKGQVMKIFMEMQIWREKLNFPICNLTNPACNAEMLSICLTKVISTRVPTGDRECTLINFHCIPKPVFSKYSLPT